MIHGSLAHHAGHGTVTAGWSWRRRGPSVPRQCAYNPRGPPFETPHKGYHYTGQRGRFFEGWYWRVTLPGDAESFALIYSVEDPRGGVFSGVGAQVRPVARRALRRISRRMFCCQAGSIGITPSLSHSFVHSFVRSFIHSFIHSVALSLVASLVRSWGRMMGTFCTIQRTCPNSGRIGVGWLSACVSNRHTWVPPRAVAWVVCCRHGNLPTGFPRYVLSRGSPPGL